MGTGISDSESQTDFSSNDDYRDPNFIATIQVSSSKVPEPTSKSQRRPENWKSNIRKTLRKQGLTYSGGKFVNAKLVGPSCADKCFYKCKKIYSENNRSLNIFSNFWKSEEP